MFTIMKKLSFTRETLLRRLRDQSDEASWEDFTDCYRPYVYAIVSAIGVQHHDCEDVVQDVLLKVWKCMPSFEYNSKKGSFRGWLATVTRNHVWRKMSRDAKKPLAGAATDDNGELIGVPPEPPEIEAIAQAEWERFISNLAWERVSPELSDTVRQVFLALMQGKDPVSIAKDCGIERNTVYVYRKRVEQRLHREIRRLDQELG
jgi:RNA polymerase sigma factor (sigma-70 family)